MSATTRNQVFTAVHTVGGLLPADMLVRISEGKDVPGSKPADYGLPSSRSVRDEAERSWEYLKPLWRELRSRLPEDATSGAPAADPTGLAATEWLTPLWRELGFGPLTPLGGTGGVAADSDADKTFPVSPPVEARLDSPDAVERRPRQAARRNRVGAAAVHAPGVPQPHRGPPVGHPHQRAAAAAAARLQRPGDRLVRRVRPRGHLRRRALQRVRAALPAAPRLPLRGRRGRGAVRLLAGEVAHARPSPPAPAPWTSSARACRRPSPRWAPASSGTPTTATCARTWTPTPSTRRCCAWSTGCCSSSSPRTARCCCSPRHRTRRSDRYARYFSTARLRRHAHCAAGAPRTATCTRRCASSSTRLGDDDGRPELGLPGLGGLFDDSPADALLHRLSLANEPLLAAVRALSLVRDPSTARGTARSTTATSAPRSWAPSTSPCWSWSPSTSAADRTFALVDAGGQRPQDHRLATTPRPR